MLEFDEQDVGLYSVSKVEINDSYDGRLDGRSIAAIPGGEIQGEFAGNKRPVMALVFCSRVSTAV
jgi:hypothetical protein